MTQRDQYTASLHDGLQILSVLLQRRVPMERIQQMIKREPDGTPSTIIGIVVDHLAARS